MVNPSRFFREVCARAVLMEFEHTQDHVSRWAAVAAIAAKMGCAAKTLRRWVRQASMMPAGDLR